MMAFSRKDYVAVSGVVADRLASFGGDSSLSEWLAVAGVAAGLADMFAADNPRFDRAKFLEACGA